MTFTFSIILLLFVCSLIYQRVVNKRKEQQQKDSIPLRSMSYAYQETSVLAEIPASLNDERFLRIASIVDDYFEKSQIFLDSRLSCTMIGEHLKMNPRLIASAIRLKYGKSLRDYINDRRIRYIEETFVATNEIRKYSLDHIGEMAGFGTRQGFYIAFKKLKNCTPKEYFEELV